MAFQASVAANMAGGVVGELAKGNNATWKARPGIIDSVGSSPLNEVGRVFTQVLGADDHCIVGGVIGAGTPFFGVLSNPKEYALRGTVAGGTLAPSLSLPQYAIGDFVYDTSGLFVPFQAAGNVGDPCDYDTTTGLIYPRTGLGNTGAGTVAITSNVATVAGVTGNIGIGVGTVFNTTNGPATVLSLGTGTGGNGTYNLSVIANQGATANTTFTTAPASGRANIPGAVVAFKNIPSAGVGIMAMNNP